MGFTALGLANIDWKRGVDLFNRILNEMGPVNYHTPNRTLLQPPLFGLLLAGFYELAPDEVTAVSFLKSAYDKVMDFHQFLYEQRDPEESGLLVITDPAEDLLSVLRKSGPDPESAPEDQQWQDPLFNALVVWSNECLMDIGTLLQEDTTDVLLWNELTIFTLNEKLWLEEEARYQAVDLSAEAHAPMPEITGFLPIIGEIPDQDQAEMILDKLENGHLRYLLQPLPEPGQYHFPPGTKISVIANWLLYHGLWRFGMSAAAAKVQRFSLTLMERFGFREVYDFSNGSPETDTEDFLPAAALYLAWE